MPAKKRRRRQLSWDEWYKLAKEYRDAHGDLLVPRDHITPEGEKLGRWIERQRAKYNDVQSVKGRLYPEQVSLLEDLGMVWKINRSHPWEAWLKQLDRYKARYGDINIPSDYEDGDYHLGNWIKAQRKRRQEGSISEGEIADLDARGMLWSVAARHRDWDDWYEDARTYYEANGDLKVSLSYLTESGDKLGYWIYKQRDVYMGRKPGTALSPERIAKLEAIHMVWDPERLNEDAWERMYEWVRVYRERQGRLPLWPAELKAPDGRSMPGWIRTQRTALAEGALSPERRHRLSLIGIDTPTSRTKRDQLWEDMYQSVERYVAENGRLPTGNRGLKAPDGRSMSRWICDQRANIAAGKVSTKRRDRLALLGITASDQP